MLACEADGHSAVAGGGGDHLRRAAADVADGKHAGPAGLDEERFAAERRPWLALW
jgi:hypothetical protein